MAPRALAVGLMLLGLSCSSALAAPGDLDPTFSGDGKLAIDLGGEDVAQDVAIQPNGRIVVGGYGWSEEETTDIATARLTATGAFDGSFNGDGLARYEADGAQQGNALALQADGKVVIAGSYGAGPPSALAVRFGSDGELDADFGSFGSALPWTGAARDVVVQADGKLVLAGEVIIGTDIDFALGRLLTSGGFDPDFNSGAPAAFGSPPPDMVGDRGQAVALQPEGLLVVGLGNGDWKVGRRLSTGAVDPVAGPNLGTFDIGGNDAANDVLVQPDGKVLIVGGGGAGRSVFFALRFVTNFSDPDFCVAPRDCNGRAAIDMGGVNFANAAALQPDGKILLAGTASPQGSQGTIAVARLLPNGLPDTSFAGDGKAYVDVGGVAEATGIAVQRDGGIVVVGSGRPGSKTEADIVVARLQGDRGPGGGPGGGGGGRGGPGSRQLRCSGKLATLVGTRGKDRLRGSRRADVIVALGGNDSVKAGGGNDLVCGGSGNDKLAGEGGKDRLLGEAGRDTLGGGPGNDRLGGGAGNDRLGGGPGSDALAGDSGADRLLGDAGRDRLSGGAGRGDVCAGGPGKDRAACERGA
jgi:uncharacterized delta-60 repeat protein